MVKLYVNVDHVATLREARGVHYPDPVVLAAQAMEAGADGITMHLREDRRHVQDHDVIRCLREVIAPFNFELAAAEEVVAICCDLTPDQATLVPEKREEVTTEGGLDVRGQFDRLKSVVADMQAKGILVSLFIDPNREAVELSRDLGASHIELHTGAYANATSEAEISAELDAIRDASAHALTLGLTVNMGHGLHIDNTAAIAAIPGCSDLNIGHALVARALELGMKGAVAEMKSLIEKAST